MPVCRCAGVPVCCSLPVINGLTAVGMGTTHISFRPSHSSEKASYFRRFLQDIETVAKYIGTWWSTLSCMSMVVYVDSATPDRLNQRSGGMEAPHDNIVEIFYLRAPFDLQSPSPTLIVCSEYAGGRHTPCISAHDVKPLPQIPRSARAFLAWQRHDATGAI